MTSTPNPIVRSSAGRGIACALGIAILAGGCSPPPGLIDAQPPGVDPRLKLARDRKTPGMSGEEPVEFSALGADTPPLVIPPAPPTAKGEVKTTESGTTYETVRAGSGNAAKTGQRVLVDYTGTLDDGRVFESTKGKTPVPVELGARQIIVGWEEAIPGMLVGEVRKLTVPPAAAYGARGNGSIPGNAKLHYEVELLNIEDQAGQ